MLEHEVVALGRKRCGMSQNASAARGLGAHGVLVARGSSAASSVAQLSPVM